MWKRLAAVERILALAEVRGDEAVGDRAAFRVDLFLELARQDHVLERGQLRLAQAHALLQLHQHRGQVRDLRADALALVLRSALRRVAIEVELAAVDVGHLGEALAQGIQADDVRIHLAEAHRHRVHPQLQLLLEVGDLLFLLGEQLAEACRLAEREAGREPRPSCSPSTNALPRMTSVKPAMRLNRERVREVQLPRAAFPLGEENNVHAGLAGMAVEDHNVDPGWRLDRVRA